MKMYILHTSLDKRHSSFNSQRKKEADRLSREIEGTVSSNFHVAEERGQKVEGDFDEEDLYSGVLVADSSSGTGKDDKDKESGKSEWWQK